MAIKISDYEKDHRSYPLQKERELVAKIKLGDFEGGFTVFEETLASIFNKKVHNIEIVKTRVLELILVLSRAVIDRGVDYYKISKINQKFMTNILCLNNIEAISRVAHITFQAYVCDRPLELSKSEKIIKMVKYYIMKNYSQQLTLEGIAKTVYLSPYYLSHLFKEVEGITVMEYLTQVRIEKAKFLLRNNQYNIYEISEKIGYKEASYFTKVFRSREGRTPTQFRRLG